MRRSPIPLPIQSQLSSEFIKQAEWRIAFAALICVVLSLLIAWRITRNITLPLKETLNAAQTYCQR
ncbi:Uncharacterised protein [Pantoea agglomerans]|uniref:Uncharacterized protein n=1 Tax=Enterobacter agglomerans TaxID=549 RepID=A0A379AE21_ENTAG|nr:Uncharacterised protein [Pantoea agglomerans]